ncbi:putative mating type 1-2 protein [Eutypa lata UCREL1]|uniref:Putative mating type 1-2 protein n=1 Tax=Eutypa lata (strain UCR-EL1) TaxID=1287681 RepID=M7TRY4_EUTLA|nr:putative mating type 1-2 protein [Eutypa lata UCREL1]
MSKILGQRWSELPHIIKRDYEARAAEEKRQLYIAHPAYKLKPRHTSQIKKRPGGRKKTAVKEDVGPIAASGREMVATANGEGIVKPEGFVNTAKGNTGNSRGLDSPGEQHHNQVNFNFENRDLGFGVGLNPTGVPSFEELFEQHRQQQDGKDKQYDLSPMS